MMNRQTFIAGAAILVGLIGGSASADESRSVRVHDQTVSARSVEPNIEGTFLDGEYAGVRFYAVPDASIPLPTEHRPEALLAKLAPDLRVESVGSPPFDGPRSQEEILASLPRTAFRLDSLFSADGARAYRLGEPPIVVYVTGYKASPGYTPGLEELKEGRPLKENRVYISAYNLTFGDLPPCRRYNGLCSSQAGR